MYGYDVTIDLQRRIIKFFSLNFKGRLQTTKLKGQNILFVYKIIYLLILTIKQKKLR